MTNDKKPAVGLSVSNAGLGHSRNAEKREPFNVICGGCEHIWTAAYTPMEMGVFAKLLKGVRCPNCGGASKNIFLSSNV